MVSGDIGCPSSVRISFSGGKNLRYLRRQAGDRHVGPLRLALAGSFVAFASATFSVSAATRTGDAGLAPCELLLSSSTTKAFPVALTIEAP